MSGAVRPPAAGTGHPSDRNGTRKGILFLIRFSEKGGEDVNIRVRREFTRLNLKIEVRDAQLDPEHRRALKEGGGKVQVPCLLISHPDDADQWLYESRDIIAWLRQRFGN